MSLAPKMDPAANLLVEPRRKIAVIIPCFNEAHSIAEVVHGFKSVLPSARIYVFDNNSTDETVAIASAAGALIRRNERPFRFFSAIGGALLAVALALGIPLVIAFIKTGLVPRQPTAILATGLVLLSALSFIAGMILDTVTRGRLEMRRLAYLAVPPADS